MASARLNKYIVDAPLDDASDSVSSTTAATTDAAAAAAVCFALNPAAAAPSSAATETLPPQNAFFPIPSPGGPVGFLPPQTGFHCTKEEDVNFNDSHSNKFDDEEEEFDLEFQVRVTNIHCQLEMKNNYFSLIDKDPLH